MNSFKTDDRGSFTIEATLVMPAVMLFTLIGVFFCIVIFQIGTVNYIAQKAASEAAYTWNNSHKDLTTGEFAKKYYSGINKGGDGLYWRILDNGILGVFGIEGFSGESLKEEKLDKVVNKYGGAITIDSATYDNNIIYSEVKVVASTALYFPSFLKDMIGTDVVKAEASHFVSDTPELIRTFNFSKYLWTEFGLGDIVNKTKESIIGFFKGG